MMHLFTVIPQLNSSEGLAGLIAIIACAAAILYYTRLQHYHDAPVSVNYHFSRKCNYECKFCFHTEKTSDRLAEDDWKRGLILLKEAGIRKLNFAGGEPFLYPKMLADMCRFAKEELNLESVSIVSNGSLIREQWVEKNAEYVDILAISCDSFNPKTNIEIGRGNTGENVKFITRVAEWCQKYNVKFKLNTVVCSLNWNEDMSNAIEKLQPFRWKVFQCLLVTGENENEQRIRDARKMLVTEEQWQRFCDTHSHLECFVPESNELMKSSYLILDEHMCYLDKGDGEEKKSQSILEVGVRKAMSQVKFDRQAFAERGGIYDWGRETENCAGVRRKELEF